MTSETKHIVTNALLFQVLWFTAILTGWLYALVPLLLHLGHFLYVERNNTTRLACLALVIVGIIADSIFGLIGVYVFKPDDLMVFGSIPLWLCYMWIGFATSLPLSLRWLFRSPALLLVFFAVGGTLSYVAGRKLGALGFDDAMIPYIATLWFSVGVLVLLAQKLASSRMTLQTGLQRQASCK